MGCGGVRGTFPNNFFCSELNEMSISAQKNSGWQPPSHGPMVWDFQQLFLARNSIECAVLYRSDILKSPPPLVWDGGVYFQKYVIQF